MVDVVIERWISKSPASSDLSTPRNSDSKLPIRKDTTRISRDPYNSSEVRPRSRAMTSLMNHITISVDQSTFLFSLLPKSKSSACVHAIQQSFATMTR